MGSQLSKEAIVFLVLVVLAVGYVVIDGTAMPVDMVGQASQGLQCLGKERCPYTVKCSNVDGYVAALPKDGGLFLGRGLLSYEGGYFSLHEFLKITEVEGGFKLNVLNEKFNLDMCKPVTVDFPIDDCDTCYKPIKIRFVGLKDIGLSSVALVEFKV